MGENACNERIDEAVTVNKILDMMLSVIPDQDTYSKAQLLIMKSCHGIRRALDDVLEEYADPSKDDIKMSDLLDVLQVLRDAETALKGIK